MHVSPNTAETSCVGASCSTHSKDQDKSIVEDSRKIGNVKNDGQKRGKEREAADEKRKRGEEESMPPVSHPLSQPESSQPLEGMDESSIP